LEALEAELSKNSTNYSKMIRNSSEQFTKVADAVSQRFTHYCKSLLSEICVLGTGTYRDQVGQEYSYEHPCFTVFMTSSTSPQVPTQRKSREQVSESQREFIDLAFRMALIDVATEPKTGAMLVIETPEASLDGLFIDKAGEMLRAFSQDPAREGNVVILTSNLNRQNLISAALGFTEPEPSWPSADETRDRVINLLQLAAENGALRQNRPLYESILSSAVKGRI
jgi:hypothetical protein